MSDQFLGEIRIFGGNFAPLGWALCDGQLLAIRQNTALFSLLGTVYGGDGVSTFGLPNLQGSAPLQQGQGNGLTFRTLGEIGGVTTVALSDTQVGAHNHPLNCTSGGGTAATAAGNYWANDGVTRGKQLYASTGGSAMNPAVFPPPAPSQPHDNMPPYLVLNFIIALKGIFPSRP